MRLLTSQYACASASLALWAVATGCASPSPAPISERSELAIVGGALATADQFPEVALIYNRATGRICSGTLVASEAVLTAAHCVSGTTPADVAVYFDTVDMRLPSKVVAATQLAVHPSYSANAQDARFDLAIITLAEAMTDRRSAAIAGELATVGESLLQVGFGRTDPADANSLGVMHYYEEASSACGSADLPAQHYICFREDDGDGVCDGDSGGPIFRAGPHGRSLVGFIAFGRGDGCRELGVGVQMASVNDFLQAELGNRLACAQDGVCDNSCDDQGIIDLDCQVCSEAADCKMGDFCIEGDCVPPKNAELTAAAKAGSALASGCSASGDDRSPTGALLLALGAVAWTMRRRRGARAICAAR
ncbi:MAG: trypsin-like serine protease [Myxococcales bacterium]|nr:trypsin-like serine protease [Myxococcales bacterium]